MRISQKQPESLYAGLAALSQLMTAPQVPGMAEGGTVFPEWILDATPEEQAAYWASLAPPPEPPPPPPPDYGPINPLEAGPGLPNFAEQPPAGAIPYEPALALEQQYAPLPTQEESAMQRLIEGGGGGGLMTGGAHVDYLGGGAGSEPTTFAPGPPRPQTGLEALMGGFGDTLAAQQSFLNPFQEKVNALQQQITESPGLRDSSIGLNAYGQPEIAPQGLMQGLSPVLDLYNTDLPLWSDFARDVIKPAVKGIPSLDLLDRLGIANDLPSAGSVLSSFVPVSAGDVALELLPGVGMVPGTASAARKGAKAAAPTLKRLALEETGSIGRRAHYENLAKQANPPSQAWPELAMRADLESAAGMDNAPMPPVKSQAKGKPGATQPDDYASQLAASLANPKGKAVPTKTTTLGQLRQQARDMGLDSTGTAGKLQQRINQATSARAGGPTTEAAAGLVDAGPGNPALTRAAGGGGTAGPPSAPPPSGPTGPQGPRMEFPDGGNQSGLPGMPTPKSGEDWVATVANQGLESVGNELRQGVAGLDFSNALRQGWATIRHGPEYLASLNDMRRGVFNEQFALERNMKIKNGRGSQHGLFIADLPGEKGSSLLKREENYAGTLIGNLPGYKQSGRGNTLFLNSQRDRVFNVVDKAWARAEQAAAEGTAGPLQRVSNVLARPNDREALARYINRNTGRGTLGRLEGTKVAAVLGLGLFSPRYQASRPQAVLNMFNYKNPRVAAEAIKDYGAAFAATASLLALANESGLASVSLDPRSSEFGKFKSSFSRLDPWAGYQQLATLTARLLSGEYEGGFDTSAKELVAKFMRGKLSPLVGRGVDITGYFPGAEAGKDFMGQKVDLEELATGFLPIFGQGLYDAAKEGLLGEALMTLPAGMFGIGVNTYGLSPAQERNKAQDEWAQQTFGKPWNELYTKEQNQAPDEIKAAQQKALESRDDALAEAQLASQADREQATARAKGVDAELKTGQINAEIARKMYDGIVHDLGVQADKNYSDPDVKKIIADMDKRRNDLTEPERAKADYYKIFDQPGMHKATGALDFKAYDKALAEWQAKYPGVEKTDISPANPLSDGHAVILEARQQLKPYLEIRDAEWAKAVAKHPEWAEFESSYEVIGVESMKLQARGIPKAVADEIAATKVEQANPLLELRQELFLLKNRHLIPWMIKAGYYVPGGLEDLAPVGAR